MLLHKLLTILVNLIVYTAVLSMIITMVCGIFGIKSPLGAIAKYLQKVLGVATKWLLEILKDLFKILLRCGLFLMEHLFELLGRIFRGLADIIREKRY